MNRGMHKLAPSSSVLRSGSIAELDKEWIIFLLEHRNRWYSMVTSWHCSIGLAFWFSSSDLGFSSIQHPVTFMRHWQELGSSFPCLVSSCNWLRFASASRDSLGSSRFGAPSYWNLSVIQRYIHSRVLFCKPLAHLQIPSPTVTALGCHPEHFLSVALIISTLGRVFLQILYDHRLRAIVLNSPLVIAISINTSRYIRCHLDSSFHIRPNRFEILLKLIVYCQLTLALRTTNLSSGVVDDTRFVESISSPMHIVPILRGQLQVLDAMF